MLFQSALCLYRHSRTRLFVLFIIVLFAVVAKQKYKIHIIQTLDTKVINKYNYQSARDQLFDVHKEAVLRENPTTDPPLLYWTTKKKLHRVASKPAKLENGRCNQNGILPGTYSPNIISLSLFGNLRQYLPTVGKLATEILTVQTYKSWRIRIYHNTEVKQDFINNITAEHSHVEFCNVESLPHYGNVSYMHPAMWRFLAAGDPTVDIFCCRDMDSSLTKREGDAVDEWLASNKTTHIMRDFPGHGGRMLAGMWGMKTKADRKTANKIESRLLALADGSRSSNKSFWDDQNFLGGSVWPLIKDDVMMHDSFSCHNFKGSIPYPSQREGPMWIGCKDWHRKCIQKIGRECPKQCRPKDHQDWSYC